MSTSETEFSIASHVAFLTFNRPHAKNAMTWGMYDALVEACDRADKDQAVRVLVLRSTGDAFIAGTDISQFTGFSTAHHGIEYERRLDAVIDRLERVSVPTIAQVQGVAAGGGCAIALACDFRVCSADAQFGVPIARTLGNCLSAANCARIADLIGPARTKDLLLTGRFIAVDEANALGLITRTVPADDMDESVAAFARELATNAPLTMRVTKETLRRLAERRRLNTADIDDLIGACYTSNDFHEGVAAFLEKRRPRFTGQ
jgi:enoyl-CoA hydratase/carnithine racemase